MNKINRYTKYIQTIKVLTQLETNDKTYDYMCCYKCYREKIRRCF